MELLRENFQSEKESLPKKMNQYMRSDSLTIGPGRKVHYVITILDDELTAVAKDKNSEYRIANKAGQEKLYNHGSLKILEWAL